MTKQEMWNKQEDAVRAHFSWEENYVIFAKSGATKGESIYTWACSDVVTANPICLIKIIARYLRTGERLDLTAEEEVAAQAVLARLREIAFAKHLTHAMHNF